MEILTQDAPRPPHIDTLTVSGRWSGYIVRNPIETRTIGWRDLALYSSRQSVSAL